MFRLAQMTGTEATNRRSLQRYSSLMNDRSGTGTGYSRQSDRDICCHISRIDLLRRSNLRSVVRIHLLWSQKLSFKIFASLNPALVS